MAFIKSAVITMSDRRAVADCRNLLHQLIEPNPQLRIPLTEVICHPWITKNGKAPFATYTAPPRNKMLRNQVNCFSLPVVFASCQLISCQY